VVIPFFPTRPCPPLPARRLKGHPPACHDETLLALLIPCRSYSGVIPALPSPANVSFHPRLSAAFRGPRVSHLRSAPFRLPPLFALNDGLPGLSTLPGAPGVTFFFPTRNSSTSSFQRFFPPSLLCPPLIFFFRLGGCSSNKSLMLFSINVFSAPGRDPTPLGAHSFDGGPFGCSTTPWIPYPPCFPRPSDPRFPLPFRDNSPFFPFVPSVRPFSLPRSLAVSFR